MPHLIDTSALQHFMHPKAMQKWPRLLGRVEAIVLADGALHLSAMTVFEIRRGLKVLGLQNQGRNKIRHAELLLRQCVVLGMSSAWPIAIEIYAAAALHKPAIKLSDGDLLIVSSAIAAKYLFVTSDARLARNLAILGYGEHVELLQLA